MQERSLLVSLDLDEALYYRASSVDEVTHRPPDIVLPGTLAPFLFLRPYAATLLRSLVAHPHREFGFFTASRGPGTDAAVAFLESLAGQKATFFFDARRITVQQRFVHEPYRHAEPPRFIKDLKKVKRRTGYGFDDILALDDNPVYPRQYGNVLYLPAYVPIDDADEQDATLLRASEFLTQLKHTTSIRNTLRGQARLLLDAYAADPATAE